MKTYSQMQARKGGFTLVEAVMALFVFTVVMSGVVAFFSRVSMQAKAGSLQSRYLAEALAAQQRISSYIQDGKAVGVVSNTITIMKPGLERSSIEYIDLDDNPVTVTNNYFLYDPDTWTSGDEVIICDRVRPCDGLSNVFMKVASSPQSIRIQFHLGDSTDPRDANTYAGLGYQGVEVRFSVAPRNLQYWYQ